VKRIAAWVASLAAAIASAESIGYELYEISGGARSLVAQGVREYNVGDVVVRKHGAFGVSFTEKEIPVANGFSAGISIFPEKDVVGFGLWLKNRDSLMGRLSNGGFSWDWFNRDDGDQYQKLQGAGRVRVTFSKTSATPEVASVEVLEDMTLRARIRPWFLSFFSNEETHRLVVKKGSVLRFSP
jgi:hypothetical protein